MCFLSAEQDRVPRALEPGCKERGCRKSGGGNKSGRTQSRTMSEPSERAASKSALLNWEKES